MGEVIYFPRFDEEDEMLKLGSVDEWMETFRSFEARLGGARIADLEEGDEKAAALAERALRKEWLILNTHFIGRK